MQPRDDQALRPSRYTRNHRHDTGHSWQFRSSTKETKLGHSAQAQQEKTIAIVCFQRTVRDSQQRHAFKIEHHNYTIVRSGDIPWMGTIGRRKTTFFSYRVLPIHLRRSFGQLESNESNQTVEISYPGTKLYQGNKNTSEPSF